MRSALRLAAAMAVAAVVGLGFAPQPALAQYGACDVIPQPPTAGLDDHIYGHAIVSCEGTTSYSWEVCLQVLRVPFAGAADAFWENVACLSDSGTTTPASPMYESPSPSAPCPVRSIGRTAVYRTAATVSWTGVVGALVGLVADAAPYSSPPVPLPCISPRV